jgi:hypothetical protein
VKAPTTLRADWHGLTVWTLQGDWTPAVLLEALATTAFRPVMPDQLVSSGWAAPLDVTHALSHEDCVAVNIVAACWRVDTKKVPKTAVHTLTAQLCAVREMEAGGKLSKAEVREVREEAEFGLRRRTPPTTEGVLVAFDLGTHQVLVGTHKPAVLDSIAAVLRRDGITVARPSLADQVVARDPQAERGLTGTVSADEPEDGEGMPRPRELERGVAHQALTWAWWGYQHSAEALPSFRSQENDWAWSLEGGLTLHLSTGEKRAVLHQDDAARDPLVRLALLQGNQVGGCSLALYVNDLEAATLKIEVREEQLALTGIHCGLKRKAGTVEDILLGEVFDRQSAHEAWLDLLAKFGNLRGSDRYAQHLGSIRTILAMQASEDLAAAVGGPQ